MQVEKSKLMNERKMMFKTKSETLQELKKRIKKCKIEKIYDFTVIEWENDAGLVLNEISRNFKSKVIVRSSAHGEDSSEKSEAGSYQSILNINPNSKKSVKKAVNDVINSYKIKKNLNPQNQILIQKQVTDIITSGVILTRENKQGLPYFIINYKDGKETDSVTKGIANNVIKIFREIESRHIPEKWKNLVIAIKEIESITNRNDLDIEFGITKNNQIIIFQVRPITSIEFNQIKDEMVGRRIQSCVKKFKSLQKKEKIFGKKTIFSDMSDWNPAEIIGNNPNPLDYSLYDFLIMKDAWHLGRSVIGYQKINQGLMQKFGTKPYVDLRASFNSLIPSNIKQSTRRKLINYYLKKLEENPFLHDKVEFEILFSCYDFSLKKRLKELKEFNFQQKEINNIVHNVLEFTNSLIDNYEEILNESEKALWNMSNNRKTILENVHKNSNYSDYLDAAISLLSDCRVYGTIHFSTMARMAFVASILLKSMIKEEMIDTKTADGIMNSINTPLTKFRSDFGKFCNEKISKKEFLEKYGHLRPGTYDITSKRYDKSTQFLNNIRFVNKNSKVKKFEINPKINNLFKKNKLLINANEFIKFTQNTLRKREELKFEFTKNLSESLELLSKAGEYLEFSRDDLKYLEINFIKKTYKKYSENNLKKIWAKKMINEKRVRAIDEKLMLPSIIFNENDLRIIKDNIVKPNYITKQSISAELVFLKDLNRIPNLENKIVLIENADPGYDWIFTKNPKGLITRYGGIASHMSIRCAELSLPAAIGCGDAIFEKLISTLKVNLDCENSQITILENKITDKYIEERKVLKSLGYIK